RGRLHQQARLTEGGGAAAGSRTDRPRAARLGASRHTDPTRHRSAAPAALASANELFLAAGNEIAVQDAYRLRIPLGLERTAHGLRSLIPTQRASMRKPRATASWAGAERSDHPCVWWGYSHSSHSLCRRASHSTQNYP